ncbi:response regulator [bacterium]|jgi:DNA-binding response OmpR family regulator|nr:response regulator [bacterium]
MRILLAEDESTISKLIKIVLGAGGHQVVGVRSISEARDVLGNGQFDLVLLDRQLEGGDGAAVLQMLESQGNGRPPVVLMSGERSFAHDDDIAQRVQAMLPKPFELDELERLVERFSA